LVYVKRGRRQRCGENKTGHAVAAWRMEGAGSRPVVLVRSRAVPAASTRGCASSFKPWGPSAKLATS